MSETAYLQIQNQLQKQLVLCDTFEENALQTVAGVDLAYWKDPDGTEKAVCCIVVLDMQTHAVLEKQQSAGVITVSYMPGFLAFREFPLILETVKKLRSKPDLYVFDGNGYLHPRHMGIASHAGLMLDVPSVGVAKTYYRVQDTDFTEPSPEAGSYTDIVIQGEIYGRVLRTHTNVKPVFLSVGNGISLETATRLMLSLVTKESRIPLPTRLADLETHIARAVCLCSHP